MEFSILAKERYSVRNFQNRPLPREIIDDLLQFGHLAPTGCNTQPQRILVIQSEAGLQKLKDCTRCHFNAPAALLVCYHKGECWTRKYDGAQSGVVDASIVATHMMLRAADLGIGCTWVMHFDPAAMRATFAIPDEIEPVALLTLGYPAEDAAPLALHSTFRPLAQTVVEETFAKEC